MKALLLSILFIAGCGHLTMDLKAHEENHCREFGIPQSAWRYEYASADETTRVCREKTKLAFVSACAQRVWSECVIRLPKE